MLTRYDVLSPSVLHIHENPNGIWVKAADVERLIDGLQKGCLLHHVEEEKFRELEQRLATTQAQLKAVEQDRDAIKSFHATQGQQLQAVGHEYNYRTKQCIDLKQQVARLREMLHKAVSNHHMVWHEEAQALLQEGKT